MDDLSELTTLTTVPVSALTQPLRDFLAASDIETFVQEDDTGLGGAPGVAVQVATKDLLRAKELLADFWAANEGPANEM